MAQDMTDIMKGMKTIPAHLARTQFGQLIDLALQKRARFVVSRNGAPAVIILALEDFLESTIESPKPLARLQAESRKRSLDLLSLSDINATIKKYRKARRTKKRA